MSVLVAEYLYIQVRGNIGEYSILKPGVHHVEGLSILVLFCGDYVGYWAGRGEEADEEASEETE